MFASVFFVKKTYTSRHFQPTGKVDPLDSFISHRKVLTAAVAASTGTGHQVSPTEG